MQGNPRQHGLHMRRHVVGPLDIMDPSSIFRREPPQRGCKVVLCNVHEELENRIDLPALEREQTMAAAT